MPSRKRNHAFRSLMWGTGGVDSASLARFAREAPELGVTDAIVNYLPDPYSLHMLEQPDNGYVAFTTWGPSLDQFVSSELSYGLYPEVYLKRNRLHLRRAVDAVTALGIVPWLFCGEPRFLPERFFRIYPHLRGPRVDNPNCSAVPLYAPCLDMPEVLAHYREMMSAMVRAFPELGGIMIYSGDSGTGICHSPALYPGPNGPRHNMHTSSGERLRQLTTVLLEAGREVNPGFLVYLGPYIWVDERIPALEKGPEGIGSLVNGYFFAGGLEDCYANLQYPGRIDEVGYEQCRAERLAVMAEQAEQVRRYGRPCLVPTTAPLEEWLLPARMVPNPYQAHDMVRMVRTVGEDLFLYGRITDPETVPFDPNKAAVKAFFNQPETPVDEVVRGIAAGWVGETHADALCEAWRLCDDACRRRPLFSWTFGMSSFLVAPLVPDPSRVTPEERRYCDRPHPFGRNLTTRPGAAWMTHFSYEETRRDWMIDRFRTISLPLLEQAEQMLFAQAERAFGEARVCLDAQARHVGVFRWFLRSQCNALEAGRTFSPGPGTVRHDRGVAEIIDDEIDNTSRLLERVRPDPRQYLAIGEQPLYEGRGDEFLEQIARRVERMRAHRDDPVRLAETNPVRTERM